MEDQLFERLGGIVAKLEALEKKVDAHVAEHKALAAAGLRYVLPVIVVLVAAALGQNVELVSKLVGVVGP